MELTSTFNPEAFTSNGVSTVHVGKEIRSYHANIAICTEIFRILDLQNYLV
jgi:hypothetical protein